MNLRLWRRKFPRPGRSAETIKLATRRSRSRRLPRRRLILSGTHWRPSIAEIMRQLSGFLRRAAGKTSRPLPRMHGPPSIARNMRRLSGFLKRSARRARLSLRRLPSPRYWQGVQWRRPTPGLNRSPRNRCSTLFRLWIQPFADPYLLQKRQNRDARGLFYLGQGLCYLRSAAHMLLLFTVCRLPGCSQPRKAKRS